MLGSDPFQIVWSWCYLFLEFGLGSIMNAWNLCVIYPRIYCCCCWGWQQSLFCCSSDFQKLCPNSTTDTYYCFYASFWQGLALGSRWNSSTGHFNFLPSSSVNQLFHESYLFGPRLSRKSWKCSPPSLYRKSQNSLWRSVHRCSNSTHCHARSLEIYLMLSNHLFRNFCLDNLIFESTNRLSHYNYYYFIGYFLDCVPKNKSEICKSSLPS